MPISQIAQGGLIAAETQFDHAASRITAAATPNAATQADSVSLSQHEVNLLAAKENYAASLGLIKVDDDMVRILETLA